MRFVTLLTALFALANAKVEEVCYDGLGCFNTGPPFSSFGRIALLPESPESIGTRFFLYTRNNADFPKELDVADPTSVTDTYYNGSLPTKMIVHGWNDNNDWVNDLMKQLLINENCNVIIVKWGNYDLYAQAAANCRVVGAQMAQMTEFLTETSNINGFANFHLMGHSLGGHIVGYAGERLPGLGRITGMDPAEPYFENFDPAVRLDETDAEFVDVIHTDAGSVFQLVTLDGGMGLWQPSGHVDVYPNGGKKQPGCGERGPMGSIIIDGVVEGIRYFFGCNHQRGYQFPIDLVASGCPWRSYRCDGGWDEFKTGRCLRCPSDGSNKSKQCNSAVTRAVKPTDGSVNNMFYMATGDKKPYCRKCCC